jgi:hypothetical protein
VSLARKALKATAWLAGLSVAVLAVILSPIGYVELVCTGEAEPQAPARFIEPQWQRSEAATFLTYPEWHIVYAYKDMAEILRDGDEHDFAYLPSVAGFWSSYCALNREAQAHGGGTIETRGMIYVIGVSFTIEMALKAVYEETIGRIATLARGDAKTEQDIVAAEMAERYALFLRQTPWYRYPFEEEVVRLNEAAGSSLRSMERRLALTLEWRAKQAYAGLIEMAAAANGAAALEIHSAVTGIAPAELDDIGDTVVVDTPAEGQSILRTPRYRRFTEILRALSSEGADVLEIAGNDDILVSVIRDTADAPLPAGGDVLAQMRRQGFEDHRTLLVLEVDRLSAFIRELEDLSGARLEHVYDY